MEAAAASDDSASRQEGAALERQREDQGAQLRLAATMGRRASQGDSESQESHPSGSAPLPKRRRSDMADNFWRIKEDTLRMEMEDRRRARDEAREEARLQREADMSIRDREMALREQELAVRKLQLEVRRQAQWVGRRGRANTVLPCVIRLYAWAICDSQGAI
jgi:hypothetical protein